MIELPEAIVNDVNAALMSGHPMTVSAVTPDGLPNVSFRGSTQVFSSSALAMWVRNPETSSLIASIAAQPTVVLVYNNFAEYRFYLFTGQASVRDDEATRKQVFETSAEAEQERDPERTGVAVVIELQSVSGRGADGFFELK